MFGDPNATALRADMGLDPQEPEAWGDWVPFDTAVRLWRVVQRLSADPMLGVTVGEQLPLGVLGLVC